MIDPGQLQLRGKVYMGFLVGKERAEEEGTKGGEQE